MSLYPQDYWSTGTTTPSKNENQNFLLTSANETGGYTTVAFERDPDTGDTGNDVQFKVNFDKFLTSLNTAINSDTKVSSLYGRGGGWCDNLMSGVRDKIGIFTLSS